MNKRLLIGFLTCFLLSGFANTARADPCPPPSCPDCYTWNGSACVWACGAGSCCGGTCYDPAAKKCCTDSGSYLCNSNQTCCGGNCCDPGKCCDSGTCKTPNTTWSGTASISVELDQTIKDKINAAINKIPGVSGVEVTEGSFSTNARWRECCDPSGSGIKHETCCDGSLTLSANFDKVTVYGGSFTKEIDFGGLWGASIDVTAGLYLTGGISASATAGRYQNDCGSGCLYGSGSIGSTIALTAEVSACCCVKIWGVDHCSPKIGVSGSASISFSGSVEYNGCGHCDGLHGEISLNDIILTGTVNIGVWSGSYSYQIYP